MAATSLVLWALPSARLAWMLPDGGNAAIALRSGVWLAQAGESAFVLLALAVQSRLVAEPALRGHFHGADDPEEETIEEDHVRLTRSRCRPGPRQPGDTLVLAGSVEQVGTAEARLLRS